MLHLARNPSTKLPIDVVFYDGLTPVAGEAANMSTRVICLDNGLTFDDLDDSFRANPATPNMGMAAFAGYTNVYHMTLDPSNWPRGYYRALTTHTSGQQWSTDFSLGLQVNRALGYSAVYDGTNLSLSLWIEENGIYQTDYTSLTQIKLLSLTGDVLADYGDLNTPNGGVFKLTAPATLLASHNYIVQCNAVCPGPAGLASYVFPLRLGIVRP